MVGETGRASFSQREIDSGTTQQSVLAYARAA